MRRRARLLSADRQPIGDGDTEVEFTPDGGGVFTAPSMAGLNALNGPNFILEVPGEPDRKITFKGLKSPVGGRTVVYFFPVHRS